MTSKKKNSKHDSNKFDEIIKSIEPLAKHITKLREQAEKYGIFVEERGLVKCKNCGLMEDVTQEGKLVVFRSEDFEKYFSKKGRRPQDTGLRFKALKNQNDLFKCPVCNTKNAPDEF